MKSLCANPLYIRETVCTKIIGYLCNILTEHFICTECLAESDDSAVCRYTVRIINIRDCIHHFYFYPHPVPYPTYNSIDAHIAGELYILNPFKRLKATARWWRQRRQPTPYTFLYYIDNGRIQNGYAYYNGLVPIYHI